MITLPAIRLNKRKTHFRANSVGVSAKPTSRLPRASAMTRQQIEVFQTFWVATNASRPSLFGRALARTTKQTCTALKRLRSALKRSIAKLKVWLADARSQAGY